MVSVVCLECGGFLCVLFVFVLTHTACSKYEVDLTYFSIYLCNGVRAAFHYSVSLFAVYQVVFTRPIATHTGTIKAGTYILPY